MIRRYEEVCVLERTILHNAERIRQEKGLTHQVMADRLGLNKVALGDILRNKRRLSVKNVERLALALGVHAADLMGDN